MTNVVQLKDRQAAPVGAPDRSCKNCMHKSNNGFPESPSWWICVRTMRNCSSALSDAELCGPGLRYWSAKPPGFWARLVHWIKR